MQGEEKRGGGEGADRTSLPIILPVELEELTGSVWRKKAVVHVESRLEGDECGVMLEQENEHRRKL